MLSAPWHALCRPWLGWKADLQTQAQRCRARAPAEGSLFCGFPRAAPLPLSILPSWMSGLAVGLKETSRWMFCSEPHGSRRKLDE